MDRPPFDPSGARGAEPPGDRPARRERRYRTVADAEYLTVSQVAGLIRDTLEQRIASPLRVIGEVSNLSARNHWYFSLKDDSAVLSCVAWASSARRFGFTPRDGDEVVATGHVSHYPPQGRTQLYVTGLAPVGAGALQQRFEAMCAELRGLGYFDEDRKRALPLLPRRVAVITSATGAAVQDVVTTARHRCPAVALTVVDVRVQGEGAAEAIARAIRWVDERHEAMGVDVIIVTRGGGSIEDLWAFNERIVADAALHCSIPLVAAIGHESDTTVVELVADLRASTPTQAAVRVVPSREELVRQVDQLGHRLRLLAQARVRQERQRFDRLARHALFRDPRALVDRARQRVDDLQRGLHRAARGRLQADRLRVERAAARLHALRAHALVERRHERVAVLADRLARAVRARLGRGADDLRRLGADLAHAHARRLDDQRRRLSALQRELEAVDPRRVLRRGFTYTTRADGALLRSARETRSGERLRTHLHDGAVDSVVTDEPERAARRSRRRRGRDQMDLFDAPE